MSSGKAQGAQSEEAHTLLKEAKARCPECGSGNVKVRGRLMRCKHCEYTDRPDKFRAIDKRARIP